VNTALEAKLARSASWFYWIAGLSLVNAFTASTNFEFVLGSGIVQIAAAIGGTAMYVIDAAVIGAFALLGSAASRRHTWAFAVGFIVYAADGVFYLMASDWLAAAFHAYVLFWLWQGISASMALGRAAAAGDARSIVMPHVETSVPAATFPESPPEM
jgi:hypothetical protein